MSKFSITKLAMMIALLSLNAASANAAEVNESEGGMLSRSQESITVSHQAANELSQSEAASSNSTKAAITTADASANANSINSNGNINNQGSSPKSSPGKKLTSIVTAFVVGTPVCMVRRTKYEESYTLKNWVGNSNSKFTRFLAGTFWMPAAIVCGCGEAPFDAFANALMYPAFSKDQLSEGKLVQNN